MDQPITLTPSDLAAGILAVCGAIAVIGKAIEWIGKGVSLLKKPETAQNEQLRTLDVRITALEHKTELYEGYFANDNSKLEEILEGMRVLQRVSLATLSHAINGNDIEELKKVQKDLQDYLTK